MSDATAPRPGREDVVEAPVRIQPDGGERIAVGPGVAGRAVSGQFPAVVEHQARAGGSGTTCEHPDLVRIRPGVEVSADDNQVTTRGNFVDEIRQLLHLALADSAAIERIV